MNTHKGDSKMEFVRHYMADDGLRAALNALTRQTFGFDFETGVTPVTLDMEQEYYRLEITRKKTE